MSATITSGRSDAALRRRRAPYAHLAGVDLACEPAPDETTVCKFCHLLERNGLGTRIFQEVGRYLQRQGLHVSSGTIVDATIINAPSSTKNASGERDPEMHQAKKGNQWFFGIKGHVGVDKKTKLIHSVAASAANERDVRSGHSPRVKYDVLPSRLVRQIQVRRPLGAMRR